MNYNMILRNMKLKSILFTIVSVMTFVSCTKSDLRSFKETDIVVLANVIQTRAGYEGTSVLPDTL